MMGLDVANLSNRIVCGAVLKSIISVAVSETSILGGIGGGWDGTWLSIVL